MYIPNIFTIKILAIPEIGFSANQTSGDILYYETPVQIDWLKPATLFTGYYRVQPAMVLILDEKIGLFWQKKK